MKYLIFIWLMLVCAPIEAQFIQIRGRILNGSTGQPLTTSCIRLEDQSIRAYSDDLGNFQVNVPAHSFHQSIIISHTGFESFRIPMRLIVDNHLDIMLQETPQKSTPDRLNNRNVNHIKDLLIELECRFDDMEHLYRALYNELIERDTNLEILKSKLALQGLRIGK
jgi:hypothetical protein